MALFAENPGNGIHDVGFAAAVRPTMQVVPDPLNVTTVRSQNDLKPTISTFRSFSKMSPFGRQLLRGCQHEARIQLDNREIQPFPAAGAKPREERTTFRSSRGGSLERQVNPSRVVCQNVWQVSVRGPAAWRKMAVREKTVTRCAPRVKPYATTCGCFASATRSPRTFTPLDGGNYFTALDDLPHNRPERRNADSEVGPIDADLREFLSAGSENRQLVSQIGMRAYGRTPPAWQFVIQFASLRLV